ncbi:hypothetical protein RAM19_07775 [Bartonella apihabitans]|uniref:hypothetical protein n=1 Tax=uncultured Bartonella sp. TaxID=104108 RepID=UPI0025CECAC7|nr:hypothetical protein [Bartonella apihabitans]WLT08001.1 hypothetical protein RAM19_07775 [Bartonella apihabitans]
MNFLKLADPADHKKISGLASLIVTRKGQDHTSMAGLGLGFAIASRCRHKQNRAGR